MREPQTSIGGIDKIVHIQAVKKCKEKELKVGHVYSSLMYEWLKKQQEEK